MPPCTHCQFTKCPKCGHDCAKEPHKTAREIAEEHGFKPPTRKINARFFETYADAPEVAGVLAKPGSGEE